MLANPALQLSPSAQQLANAMEQRRVLRKRKPEAPPENNERLSKRLSLLNLEHSGTKLYVPVESQQLRSTPPSFPPLQSLPNGSHGSIDGKSRRRLNGLADVGQDDADSMMQLDDSKYKVYIRNLDDELTSESESEDGGLIFLPDIEKHLRNSRIPPAVLARQDPDLLNKQLVLYRVPSSISIPQDQDSVRKAIIEARARLREKQQEKQPWRNGSSPPPAPDGTVVTGRGSFPSGPAPLPPMPMPQKDDDDPDAMELD